MSSGFVLTGGGGIPPASIVLGTTGLYILGRSSKCAIPINDLSVSRRHAEIVVSESSVTVKDLGSMNGTFLDGVPVVEAVVNVGQQVRFGNVSFALNSENPNTGNNADSELSTRRILSAAPQPESASRNEQLSPAQQRVLNLILDGLNEKQMAVRLHLSPHTVHNHIRAIYAVFSVHSRTELLIMLLGREDSEDLPKE